MGGLIAESQPGTVIGGWNAFKIPDTPLLPGYYWLAYLYDASSTYTVAHDPLPAGSNTVAFSASVTSWLILARRIGGVRAGAINPIQ